MVNHLVDHTLQTILVTSLFEKTGGFPITNDYWMVIVGTTMAIPQYLVVFALASAAKDDPALRAAPRHCQS